MERSVDGLLAWMKIFKMQKSVQFQLQFRGSFCVTFACFPLPCVGFLQMLRFPPTDQKQA